MKLTNQILCAVFLAVFSVSCGQEDEWMSGQEPDAPADHTGTVDLAFRFSSAPVDARSAGSDIAAEEGDVKNLLYAVFRNKECKVRDYVENLNHSTSSGNNVYTVTGVNNEWLDENSEVFAVANVPDSIKDKLNSDNPDYEIPEDEPLLVKMVEEQIERKAYEHVYDTYIIPGNYSSDEVPKDGKVHFFPADSQNFTSKKWNKETLPDSWRFKTYAEFTEKKNSSGLPSGIREIYAEIEEDLQCRVACYKSNEYNGKKTELLAQEEKDHAIRDAIRGNKDLKRYLLWKNYTYSSDLNTEAAQNASRLIESPVMAGYYALEENFGSVITVPVEHVYSRVWFNFRWLESQDAEQIVIDSVMMEGMPVNTRLFNVSEYRVENNPSVPLKRSVAIRNKEPEQMPFLADLSNDTAPWHLGDEPEMLLQHAYPDYEVLCRYTWPDGTMDKYKHPNRYYMYGYQWGGVYLEDDPLVSVYYHFKSTDGGTIYKKATARLYDDTHQPGKRHHGLLRNYTYQLNCIVNTVTDKFDIQVMSVPWYRIEIDDIPPFE